MWIQLLRPWFGDCDGAGSRTHYAGEWIEVGKTAALRLLSENAARAPRPVTLDVPERCGVVVRGQSSFVRGMLAKVAGLEVIEGGIDLAFERTLLLDGALLPSLEHVTAGFGFLGPWHLAAPLASYRQLAADIGSAADRERTRSLIHDLRVPYRDTRLLFMRRCPECERLIELWKGEEAGGDERLAFMRALYRVKPLEQALPVTWVGGKA